MPVQPKSLVAIHCHNSGMMPRGIHVFALLLSALSLNAQSSPYAGSAACKSCHAEVYNRWTKTRMANVVRDPKEFPEAIIPDLSKPDPLLTFKKEDIAFTYGSKW